MQDTFARLYARYLCSRDALGLKAAARSSARATIGYLVYNLLARRTRPMQPVGQARRATIGYLVYNGKHLIIRQVGASINQYYFAHPKFIT